MKKLKLHIWSQRVVIVLVGLLAVGYVAIAYTNNSNSQPTTLIENAGGVTINNPEQPVEQNLGAVVDPNNLPNMHCWGDDCVANISGSFIDASTTIAAFPCPWQKATSTGSDVAIIGTTENGVGKTAATSTVELIRLGISGVATTSYSVICGATASPYAAYTASAANILVTAVDGIATSTIGIVENNVATSTAAYLGGIAGGQISKIFLTPTYPYLVCWVDSMGYDNAFTDTGNTFDGVYSARISRPRF